jgi:hypothetical protein
MDLFLPRMDTDGHGFFKVPNSNIQAPEQFQAPSFKKLTVSEFDAWWLEILRSLGLEFGFLIQLRQELSFQEWPEMS